MWKNAVSSRRVMTDSLIEKLTEEKPSQYEVIKLLGNNSEEDMKVDQGDFLVYFVRPKTTMGLRSEWLYIKFEENRVIEAYLAEID